MLRLQKNLHEVYSLNKKIDICVYYTETSQIWRQTFKILGKFKLIVSGPRTVLTSTFV